MRGHESPPQDKGTVGTQSKLSWQSRQAGLRWSTVRRWYVASLMSGRVVSRLLLLLSCVPALPASLCFAIHGCLRWNDQGECGNLQQL